MAVSELGGVLIGEQLVGGPAGHVYWPPGADEVAAAFEQVRSEIVAAAEAGVGAIVDVTPIDGGRDLSLFEAVGAAGTSIVFSTGLGFADGVPPAFKRLDAVQLAAVYVRELTEGVPGTASRAGVITVSAGSSFDPFDDVAVLAAAFAHAEAGAPIVAQAPPARISDLVVRLVGRGIDPERIVATGLDSAGATWTLVDGVARQGVLLGFTAPEDVLQRGAAIAYAIRRFGPSRVCLARGTPFWQRPVPGTEAPEPSTSAGLREILDAVSSFGVEQSVLQNLLGATAEGLFAPLREASLA